MEKIRARLKRCFERVEMLEKEKNELLGTDCKKLLNSASNMLFLIDDKYNITFANKAFLKAIGKKNEEVAGKKCYAVVHGRTKPIPECPFAKSMKTRKSEEIEYYEPRLKKLLLIQSSPIINRAVKGCMHTITDITEREEEKEELQKSEERFRIVAENAKECVWEVDAKGMYTYVSSAAKKIYGYAPKEIIGKKHFYDMFHPDEREKLKKQAFETFAKKQPLKDFPNKNIDKKGNTKFLLTSGVPILDSKGKLLGYMGVDIDITEIKKAEEKIREAERKYRAIFTGTSDGIIGADIETKRFVFANPQICKMLGYTEKELFKLGVPDIHLKKDWPYVMNRFNLLAKGKIKVAYNLPVLRKDKKVFYCDISVGHAEVRGKHLLFGVFRDITERKKTEDTLKKAKEEVEQKVLERTKELKEASVSLEKQNKDIILRHIDLAEIRKDLEDKNIELQEAKKKLEEQSRHLEKLVKKRTEQLNRRVNELERFNRLAVGREFRMIELKKEIKQLEKARER